MKPPTRHRKAFYQKQNSNHNIQQQKALLPNKSLSKISNKIDDQDILNYNSSSQNILSELGSNLQQNRRAPFYPYQHDSDSCILQQQQRKSHRYNSTLATKLLPKNETEAYCRHYSRELLESHLNFTIPNQFLSRHQIDYLLRARMMDWMSEVITSYKLTHKAYFASVQIMDRYFEKETHILQPNHIHTVGVVSMMIASKMQEMFPLKLHTVFEKIGHKKIPLDDIVLQEEQISQVLQFKLNSWTFYDLAICKVHLLLQILNNGGSSGSAKGKGQVKNFNSTNNYSSSQSSSKTLVKDIEQNMTLIQDVCSYISKHLYFDYQFYCSHTLSVHSDIVLKLTFQLLHIPCQLDVVFTSQQIQVELCINALMKKIKNFDSIYRGSNNMKKFTSELVKNIVDENALIKDA